MPIEYAFVTDVWGKSSGRHNGSRQDPACGLLKQEQRNKRSKGYDNIIDAYLDEPPKNVDIGKGRQHYDLTKRNISRSEKCGFDVVGVNEEPSNALSFERYFSDNNIFDETPALYPSPQRKVHQEDDEGDANTNSAPMMDWSNEAGYQNPNEEEALLSQWDDVRQEDYHQKNNGSGRKEYLDLALYVFSGVLLIFIMEQILQLGMYLGR